jgi:anthranilate phosphoribosyltransferase
MFAPHHHPAMKYAAPVRKELGMRTILNILGPLTNPAGAPNQVMGVFHADLVGIQARVLQQLGSRQVMVVHGEDGLDEITLTGKTHVAELKQGFVTEYTIEPQQFGLDHAPLESLRAADETGSKAMLLDVLNNKHGPAKDIVMLNAGAAIYVAGITSDLWGGVARAREMIESGLARQKLEALIGFTNSVSGSA